MAVVVVVRRRCRRSRSERALSTFLLLGALCDALRSLTRSSVSRGRDQERARSPPRARKREEEKQRAVDEAKRRRKKNEKEKK